MLRGVLNCVGAEAPEKRRNSEGFWRPSSEAASYMFKNVSSTTHIRLESYNSNTMSAKGSLLLIGDLHFVRQRWEELGHLEGVTGLKVCTVHHITAVL